MAQGSGAHLSNYAAALLAKKQWFVANEPTRARQLRHVLYAKDFLIYRLTGQAVTDYTSGPDASSWDARALAHTACENVVPRPALPWDVAGPLDRTAATALGLAPGIPVVVGAHDGICANVGAGAGYPGAYAITLGTHAVVRTIRTDVPNGAFRFYGLPPGRHVIGGNAVMGGRAADWFLDIVFGANDRTRARHFKTMDTAAGAVPPGAAGVRFLPFLSGQVAPESRPGANGVFTGLRAAHDRATLYRGVLEGGAFAVRAVFDQIHAWCGDPSVIRLTGGGATSALWCDILANMLGRPLESSDAAVEGRGAAIFATVALGLYPDYDAAAQRAGADHTPASARRVGHRAIRDAVSRLAAGLGRNSAARSALGRQPAFVAWKRLTLQLRKQRVVCGKIERVAVTAFADVPRVRIAKAVFDTEPRCPLDIAQRLVDRQQRGAGDRFSPMHQWWSLLAREFHRYLDDARLHPHRAGDQVDHADDARDLRTGDVVHLPLHPLVTDQRGHQTRDVVDVHELQCCESLARNQDRPPCFEPREERRVARRLRAARAERVADA